VGLGAARWERRLGLPGAGEGRRDLLFPIVDVWTGIETMTSRPTQGISDKIPFSKNDKKSKERVLLSIDELRLFLRILTN
jgi:hypothetical protein